MYRSLVSHISPTCFICIAHLFHIYRSLVSHISPTCFTYIAHLFHMYRSFVSRISPHICGTADTPCEGVAVRVPASTSLLQRMYCSDVAPLRARSFRNLATSMSACLAADGSSISNTWRICHNKEGCQRSSERRPGTIQSTKEAGSRCEVELRGDRVRRRLIPVGVVCLHRGSLMLNPSKLYSSIITSRELCDGLGDLLGQRVIGVAVLLRLWRTTQLRPWRGVLLLQRDDQYAAGGSVLEVPHTAMNV